MKKPYCVPATEVQPLGDGVMIAVVLSGVVRVKSFKKVTPRYVGVES